MASKRETMAFVLVLSACITAFFHESLIGGKVLSPADVLLVSASFRDESAADYEPANRLLMDPVLQFQPWLEFNRSMIRSGRLPLWNGHSGCGAPHLANGQSAVFDPFHLLAYLGPTPRAYAWIAAGRLFAAGLGMFLLARAWGLGPWGRWFAGLVYPFCGFTIVWLLFPVTAVAIWMPWSFLATEWVFRAPGRRAAGWLAVVVALVILGGHIQTSAHVLLASGLYAVWRAWSGRREAPGARPALIAWVSGVMLGLAVAAVQIVPLGSYLARSPVWGDRQRERPSWWLMDRPRVLDAVCTAFPYAYGSQRGGHPNLARALGVNNLNESAGGYAGLATLVWLAPLAWLSRARSPRVAFLAGMTVLGAMGAYRWPPVDNLLRALPVLEVTDNRRLTLWVAFGLTMLGAIGLDHLGESFRLRRGWIVLWSVGALGLLSMASIVSFSGPKLRERAIAHYHRAASKTPGADPADYRERAERQARQALSFLPRYFGLAAAELGLLAAMLAWSRRARGSPRWTQTAIFGLTLGELGCFGFGLNPAIEPERHRFEPPVIARLRRELPREGRALGLGEELPPNVLMRFGLSDIRNYDSIELTSSLEWFAPLYEPGRAGRTSRREITWEGVVRSRDRLRGSGVGAVVAAMPPPPAMFPRVDRVGRVWIAWLDAMPWADADSPETRVDFVRDHGRARIRFLAPSPDRLVVRESWAPGWRASLDGEPVSAPAGRGAFLEISLPKGNHELLLEYDPDEVRIGLAVSSCSIVALILVLTGIRLF